MILSLRRLRDQISGVTEEMPGFELVVLIRKLDQPALKTALKRSANYIFALDGIIRNIDNLGFRQLPYFIRTKGNKYNFANYFVFTYDIGVNKPKLLLEKLNLDLDIVKATNFLHTNSPLDLHVKEEEPECTMSMDLLPAPFRSTVMQLEELGRKKRQRNRGKNVNDTDFSFI